MINKIDKSTENKLDLHHIEVMIGVSGLLVTAIALHFQFKNNNKHYSTTNFTKTN